MPFNAHIFPQYVKRTQVAASLRQLVVRVLALRRALPEDALPAELAQLNTLLVLAGRYFGQAASDEIGEAP